MSGIFSVSIALGAAAMLGGSGCAMSSPRPATPRCSVVDEARLPADSGGAAALCAAVEQAVAARAPDVSYSVEIRVVSASMLAAVVTRDGRPLPEQKFASMDRDLSRASFERFAAALADRLAKEH